MKRDELTALGLTSEQVEAVMASAKQSENVLREQLTTLTAERDNLKATVDTHAGELKKLEKANKDNEELAAQLTQLREQAAAQSKEFEEQQYQAKLDKLLGEGLAEAKVRDAGVVGKLINRDELSIADDGTLKGLSDQLKPLQEQNAYLFVGQQRSKYTPEGGTGQEAGAGDLAAAMKQDGFNFTEWAKAQEETGD
jgi:Phage minor structural protein GP20.